MFKLSQKYAPIISILLLLALIAALFFSPPSARLLSPVIIVFGLGTAILFTVHTNWVLRQAQEPHNEDGLTNAEFVRNTIIDLLGLALVMGAAVWFGRLTGFYVGGALGNLAGIIVAMVVGAVVAFMVKKLWGEVAEPMKVKAA